MLLTDRQRPQAAGIGLNELADLVGKLLEIEPVQVRLAVEQPERMRARSLFRSGAVWELGLTATVLSRERGISQPPVSQAVRHGERGSDGAGLAVE